ncbi:hypothetical protein HX866_12900 [Pseudomonas gingeri]|uniref:hypothetical protein n=1 Tax=Pseudomonas gingeri TaxID=117681 RepID=UPI0015A1DA31|nr:hypothetical protein [Pseudomonas gingeri]NWA25789.1 hypothetical protein [Pseudomonas gingeri]
MDHNLIDQQILALLRTPIDQRTPECLAEALQRIAEATEPNEPGPIAALPGQTNPTSIQREQLKLAAIASLLKQESNYRASSTQLNISEYNSDRYQTLTILLTTHESSSDDSFMIGSGSTAEGALRDLHTVKKTRTELVA